MSPPLVRGRAGLSFSSRSYDIAAGKRDEIVITAEETTLNLNVGLFIFYLNSWFGVDAERKVLLSQWIFRGSVVSGKLID